MLIFIKIVRLLFEIFDIPNFPISQSRFLCRMISRENFLISLKFGGDVEFVHYLNEFLE